jgi:hypothetical protein
VDPKPPKITPRERKNGIKIKFDGVGVVFEGGSKFFGSATKVAVRRSTTTNRITTRATKLTWSWCEKYRSRGRPLRYLWRLSTFAFFLLRARGSTVFEISKTASPPLSVVCLNKAVVLRAGRFCGHSSPFHGLICTLSRPFRPVPHTTFSSTSFRVSLLLCTIIEFESVLRLDRRDPPSVRYSRP